ncbi:hypothetical protein ACLBSJ_33215, partial [Klebsiella pneumoniae]|uniref:DUF7208 family protein n=1 Tax=Klebsiella pneumoniae TaxID=573 RepID=UPI003968272C
MSAIDQLYTIVTRTAYGSYLQTSQYLGIPFKLIPNTTLNEKFSIQQNDVHFYRESLTSNSA